MIVKLLPKILASEEKATIITTTTSEQFVCIYLCIYLLRQKFTRVHLFTSS